MITYLDTSSLLKLVIDEDGSERIELIWDNADTIVSSALIVVESRAALAVHATIFSSTDTILCDAAERRGLHVTNLLKP